MPIIPAPKPKIKRTRKPKTDRQKQIERLDDLYSEYVSGLDMQEIYGSHKEGEE